MISKRLGESSLSQTYLCCCPWIILALGRLHLPLSSIPFWGVTEGEVLLFRHLIICGYENTNKLFGFTMVCGFWAVNITKIEELVMFLMHIYVEK